jgi:hypothetical protein
LREEIDAKSLLISFLSQRFDRFFVLEVFYLKKGRWLADWGWVRGTPFFRVGPARREGKNTKGWFSSFILLVIPLKKTNPYAYDG